MKCALCQREATLANSHIIPEFLYASLYDEKHRFHEISADPETGNRYRQKGLRERLLCEPCEQKLSVYEGYARKLLRGGVQISVQPELQLIRLADLNYQSLKLFQISVLWRAGVSTLREFEQVRLGVHAERMRRMLAEEDPGGAADYGCIMCALMHQDELVEELVVPPTWARLAGLKAYRFVFGGLVFVYVVSGISPPQPVVEFFAQPNGTALVRLQQMSEMRFLADAVGRMHDLGKLAPT